MTQLVVPRCMIEKKNTVFSLLRSSDQKKWQTGSCCATRRKYLRGLEAPSEWRSPRHSFPIKAKKGFSSLQLDLMEKIFTRSPKNGLSQTLQLFTPAQETRHLISDVLPLSSLITPELSAERASTKPHWDCVDQHHEEFRHTDSKVVSPGLAPCANWRLNVGREGAPQLVPQEPTMEPSTLRSAPPASSNAFFNAEAEWHFGLS